GRELGEESRSRRAHSERRGCESRCRRGGERRRKRRIREGPDVRPRVGGAADLGDGLANVTLQGLRPRLAAAGEKHGERSKQAAMKDHFSLSPEYSSEC